MFLTNDNLRKNYWFCMPLFIAALLTYMPLIEASNLKFNEDLGNVLAICLVKGSIVGGLIEIYLTAGALLFKIFFRKLYMKISAPPSNGRS